MRVFSMVDPDDPMRSVDVFVEEPIGFEELYEQARVIDVAGTPVRIASIPDLIRLKRMAGRPLDEADIAALESIMQRQEETDGSGA